MSSSFLCYRRGHRADSQSEHRPLTPHKSNIPKGKDLQAGGHNIFLDGSSLRIIKAVLCASFAYNARYLPQLRRPQSRRLSFDTCGQAGTAIYYLRKGSETQAAVEDIERRAQVRCRGLRCLMLVRIGQFAGWQGPHHSKGILSRYT